MTIVVDSNIVAALMLPLPYSPQAISMMGVWRRSGKRLIAPTLFEYEITTLIRRSILYDKLERTQMLSVLSRLLGTGLVTVPPTRQIHEEALELAERIGQSKAYDAQYLALASHENAPFWTADRRLANAAQTAGLGWVHWVGDWTA